MYSHLFFLLQRYNLPWLLPLQYTGFPVHRCPLNLCHNNFITFFPILFKSTHELRNFSKYKNLQWHDSIKNRHPDFSECLLSFSVFIFGSCLLSQRLSPASVTFSVLIDGNICTFSDKDWNNVDRCTGTYCFTAFIYPAGSTFFPSGACRKVYCSF